MFESKAPQKSAAWEQANQYQIDALKAFQKKESCWATTIEFANAKIHSYNNSVDAKNTLAYITKNGVLTANIKEIDFPEI